MTGPAPQGPATADDRDPSRSTPRRLVHLGNAVVDDVLLVDRLPARGGDVVARGSFSAVGGGFNVMAAARRQGMPVVYAGMHGTGPRGDLVRAALGSEGIAVLQSAVPGEDSGRVLTLVEHGGERTFVTVPGAEARLTAEALARVTVGDTDLVYLTGYSLAHSINRAALTTWLPGIPDTALVLLDPGPLVGDLPRRLVDLLLERADWCTLNTRELEDLTGRSDVADASVVLSARTRRGVVVRTGPAGCAVTMSGDRPVHVPGFAVDAVDLNGAGDTHAGVFAAGLAQGLGPRAAARRANAAAALAVTRSGPATAPTVVELEAFLDARTG